MKRSERRDLVINERKIVYHQPGNPEETEWNDKFGTHFEVRFIRPGGEIFSRRITTSPGWGWMVTWDECRKSVMDAALRTQGGE